MSMEDSHPLSQVLLILLIDTGHHHLIMRCQVAEAAIDALYI